jgi:hypothetical protein
MFREETSPSPVAPEELDTVCGMTIDPTAAAGDVEHAGRCGTA